MRLKGNHTELAVVTNYGETEEEVELFGLMKDNIDIDPDEQINESDYFGEDLTQTTVYGGNPTITFQPDADDEFGNVETAGVINADGEYNFSDRSVEAIRVLNYPDNDSDEPVAAVDAVGCEMEWGGLDVNEDGDIEGEFIAHVNERLVLNPDDVIGGD